MFDSMYFLYNCVFWQIYKNDSFDTVSVSNFSGWIIFPSISIPSMVLMLGLLKNEFASTAKI